MRTLKQLIDAKDKRLAFVTPDQTVLRALEIMAEADVGALLVLDGRNLLGVFSERDYARKVILQGKASRNTAVSEVMSDKVYSVTTEQSIEDCMAIMTDKHVRHLPVVDKTGNTTVGNYENALAAGGQRYVRVTITGATAGFWAYFYELQIFGK